MGAKCEKCQHENEGWVPEERLQRVSEQRRASEAKVAELEGKLGEATKAVAEAGKAGPKAEALAAKVAELEAKLGEAGLREGIMRAGITDAEGIDVATVLWGRVPEASRPKGGIGEWLTTDGAPKAIKAYIGTTPPPRVDGKEPPKAPDQPQPKHGEQPPPGLPPSNRGTVPTPPGPGGYTAERIAAMSPEEYAEHRGAILAQKR